jgi:pimeloyl-ACP methyl ester carboxylesterase
VHWIEFGDEDASGRDGTPIVFVHGLGGSHLNWCLIGPRLAEWRRAVALDLHGFGLTPGTRATSNVHHNAMLLNRFVREVTGTPVILVGNEAAARNPGWETVILPGVGHTPQLEVPESVTGTLRDWLRTHF